MVGRADNINIPRRIQRSHPGLKITAMRIVCRSADSDFGGVWGAVGRGWGGGGGGVGVGGGILWRISHIPPWFTPDSCPARRQLVLIILLGLLTPHQTPLRQCDKRVCRVELS